MEFQEIVINHFPFIISMLGLVFLGLELLAGIDTGLDLFFTGLILIFSGVIGWFFGSSLLVIGLVIILVLMYFFIGREMVKQRIVPSNTKTNVDKLVGQEGIVIKAIAVNQAGQVKVDGEVWRAKAKTDIAKGQTITVTKHNGTLLTVQQA